MNRIKNSFSNIKASEKFKDKLTNELLNVNRELNINAELNSHGRLIATRRNLYIKPSITAATLLLLIGIIGFKLMTDASEKESNSLNSIAYAPKEESQIDDTYTDEKNKDIDDTYINEENKDIDDTNLITEDTLPSATNENQVTPQVEQTSSKNKAVRQVDKTATEDKAISQAEKNSSESEIISNVETPSTDNNLDNKDNVIEDISSSPSNSRAALLDETTSLDSNVLSEDKTFALSTLNNSVFIPKIELPKANTKAITTAKMMPLIVYKGNVYIYAPISIPSENAKNLLGRKLGTTTGNINEWSTQSDYSHELASNIGVTDVYAVNGYDENFRIMTNITLEDGKNYPEFYECLNGITINNGQDIMEKLKLQGNIAQAKFQTFSDWNNGTGTFYTINDDDLLNRLFNEINNATPYLPEDIEASLGDYRNDDQYKEISFDLKDGSKNVTFTILKSGYVYYGYPGIYLKIDDTFCAELWDNLGIMRIN